MSQVNHTDHNHNIADNNSYPSLPCPMNKKSRRMFRIITGAYRPEYHILLQWNDNDSTNNNNFMKMNLPKLIEIQVLVHPVQ
jgi:hypothetical protein